MKKKTGARSKKRKLLRKPIVQYVVNARPPKRVVLLQNNDTTYNGYSGVDTQYSVRDLRILMVLDQFNIGGTETHVLTNTRELLRKGAHVVVVGKRGDMRDAFAALGCPVYELDFVTDQFLRNDALEAKLISQLKQIINTERISVIHIHQIPSSYFAIKAAEQLHIPHMWTLHTNNRYTESDIAQLKNSKAVVCVSPALVKELPGKKLPVQLIPNGIDTVQFDYRPFIQSDLREELGIPEDAPVLMYAGRLSWEKADICRDMIEACRELRTEQFPNLHILIVGEGRHSEPIKELVSGIHEELNCKFIHVMGSSLSMSTYYSLCDVFVGTGRSALEALACCRPVVAVGVQGFLGLVHPENYRLAWETWFADHYANEERSVEKLKSAIEQALDMPPHEKMEIGWVNRNLVKEQFNITRTTDMLMSAYANILNNRYVNYEVN